MKVALRRPSARIKMKTRAVQNVPVIINKLQKLLLLHLFSSPFFRHDDDTLWLEKKYKKTLLGGQRSTGLAISGSFAYLITIISTDECVKLFTR